MGRCDDRICVMQDNSNDEVRFHIGEKMKQILDLEPSTMIEYKHHESSMRDMSSFRNAKGGWVAACDVIRYNMTWCRLCVHTG